ncbi:MAG: hypothetical protein U9P11_09810 [Pseudomonadota bacterium]|nr:hypothetical protein [Pseudomonadota bacterium]
MSSTVLDEAQEITPQAKKRRASKGKETAKTGSGKTRAAAKPVKKKAAPASKDAVKKKTANKKAPEKKVAKKTAAKKSVVKKKTVSREKTASSAKSKSSRAKRTTRPEARPIRPLQIDEPGELPDVSETSSDDPKSLSWMAAQAVSALNVVKDHQAEKRKAMLAKAEKDEAVTLEKGSVSEYSVPVSAAQAKTPATQGAQAVTPAPATPGAGAAGNTHAGGVSGKPEDQRPLPPQAKEPAVSRPPAGPSTRDLVVATAATRRRLPARPVLMAGIIAVAALLGYSYWNTGHDDNENISPPAVTLGEQAPPDTATPPVATLGEQAPPDTATPPAATLVEQTPPDAATPPVATLAEQASPDAATPPAATVAEQTPPDAATPAAATLAEQTSPDAATPPAATVAEQASPDAATPAAATVAEQASPDAATPATATLAEQTSPEAATPPDDAVSAAPSVGVSESLATPGEGMQWPSTMAAPSAGQAAAETLTPADELPMVTAPAPVQEETPANKQDKVTESPLATGSQDGQAPSTGIAETQERQAESVPAAQQPSRSAAEPSPYRAPRHGYYPPQYSRQQPYYRPAYSQPPSR